MDNGARKTVKQCPQCHAWCFSDMDVCFGCLHDFTKDGPSSDRKIVGLDAEKMPDETATKEVVLGTPKRVPTLEVLGKADEPLEDEDTKKERNDERQEGRLDECVFEIAVQVRVPSGSSVKLVSKQ